MSSPLHKYEAPTGWLCCDGSAQDRRHGGEFGGSSPQIFFVHPQILLRSEKFALNIWWKQNFSP